MAVLSTRGAYLILRLLVGDLLEKGGGLIKNSIVKNQASEISLNF